MIVTKGILDLSPLRTERSGSLPVRDSNLYMPSFFFWCFVFLRWVTPRNLVATVFLHLPKQPPLPPPPPSSHNCLDAAALPRQALTVEPTGHGAAAFCEPRFLYIATCTHFRLCRSWIYVVCMYVLRTSGDSVFSRQEYMTRSYVALSLFLSPTTFYVSVHAYARMCTHCVMWAISCTCKQNKKKKGEWTCVLRLRCENKATRLLYKKLTL